MIMLQTRHIDKHDCDTHSWFHVKACTSHFV